MKFSTRRRRQPPAVIIVSMIDILIVMLIFLMVTTTFRQQPALKLALPESQQTKTGVRPNASDDHAIIAVLKQPPYFYLDDRPIALDQLQANLQARAARNPALTLSIRADTEAPFGQIVKIMDAAKAANIKTISAFTKPAPGPAKK